jgi:hypothetical protein
MADDWKEYQEEVASSFRNLGLEADTDVSIEGVRTTHDIDVYVKSHQVPESHSGRLQTLDFIVDERALNLSALPRIS